MYHPLLQCAFSGGTTTLFKFGGSNVIVYDDVWIHTSDTAPDGNKHYWTKEREHGKSF